jgi:hypothetical protein
MAQEPLEVGINAGFDGFYKSDTWVPIRVTVANEGAALEARVQWRSADEPHPANVFYTPVSLPTHSRKELTLYAPLSGQRRIAVDLLAGDTRLLSGGATLSALSREDFLCGVVGGDSSLLYFMSALKNTSGNRVAVAHLSPAELPEQAQAWASLDLLVFNDVDTAALSREQREALATWVAFGGHLVVAGGPNGERTAAGLADLLPVKVGGSRSLEALPALAEYAAISLKDSGPYVISLAAVTNGSTLIEQDGIPLLARRPYGRGKVDYLALDLALAPLNAWEGNQPFWEKLLSPIRPDTSIGLERGNWQPLYQALSLISGMGLPRPGSLFLYIIIYIACIGPLNYLFLRRIKRPEWAWATIPLIVLLFSGFGYLSGFHLRGERPIVRQIIITQVQRDAPLALVDAFVGIYSPQRTVYDAQLPPGVLAREFLSSGGSESNLDFSQGDDPTAEALRADIGGMPAFVVHASGPVPAVSASLRSESNAKGRPSRVEGSIINNSGEPLTDCLLLWGDTAAQLGTLHPGENQVYESFSQYVGYIDFYQPSGNLEMMVRSQTVGAIHSRWGGREATGPDDLYLVGWQERPPLNVNVKGHSAEVQADSVYVIGLPVEVGE